MVGLLMLLALAGCVTASTIDASAPPPGGVVALRVEGCVDRTHTQGRDLGAEATKAFIEALGKSQSLRVDPAAPYTLTCDVSGFAEGSALKRWLLPGWGATVGEVAVMVTDTRSGVTVLIARGSATVGSGGLYTIGADSYILPTAVKDVVGKIEAWAGGKPQAVVR
ncbi:MAG: hypothetical protein KGL55_17800 [Rhodospirillales bacterium]|nr:hypothetical protein [Rhodospirillales bacterium]MDE2577161.1 hypothetical protein [Rhodospirillales bacterium]